MNSRADYNFWQKLKNNKKEEGKPIVVLAPMADVTDPAFRIMFAKYGKPDVTWTEFVSADGLSHEHAKEKLKRDLLFTEAERPIVAQLFTSNKNNMYEAVKLCRALGFDGVDLNMGCPDRNIEKQGSGAAHIKDFETAKEVFWAARDAAQDMPVSIKTRVGYNKPEINTWIKDLLSLKPVTLTVHLRTRKEMSLADAHWDYMHQILDLRDEVSKDTIIIGNGDVKSLKEADQRYLETGCDGVMVGRGVFGNPFFFNRDIDFDSFELKDRFAVLIEHTKLFEELLGSYKNFSIMKKHYKAYINNFDGAKELRMVLMDAQNSFEVEEILNNFLKNK